MLKHGIRNLPLSKKLAYGFYFGAAAILPIFFCYMWLLEKIAGPFPAGSGDIIGFIILPLLIIILYLGSLAGLIAALVSRDLKVIAIFALPILSGVTFFQEVRFLHIETFYLSVAILLLYLLVTMLSWYRDVSKAS